MRKQDQLVQLIASLSPNEKRYFKLFSIQPGEKKYLELFDALDGEDTYNAAALSQKLGVSPSRLAVDKAYLNKALLRSLVHYDEEVTEINTVYHGYLEGYALLERRMFEYALDVLDKAIAKAWQLEMFQFMATMLGSRGVCLYSLSRFDEMQEMQADFKKIADGCEEITQLQLLRGRATDMEMRRQGKEGLDELLQHPLLKRDVNSLIGLKAKTAWFDIMQRYYIACDWNPAKQLELARHEMEIYEGNPQIKNMSPVAYLVAFTRVASSEADLGNYANAIIVTHRLVEVLDKGNLALTAARIKSLKSYTQLLLAELYFFNGEYGNAITTNNTAYQTVADRTDYEKYTAIFYFACTLLHSGKYHDALDKVNELLQMKTDVRMDIQPFVRALTIMLQIDLGNEEMVPYLVRTTKAWMKRNDINDPETNAFLGFVYPLPNTPILKKNKIWLNMQNAVSEGMFPMMCRHIHLDRWVNRKIGK